ncbi:MAG TPA: hypothetical protein VMR44_05200 [Thermoanaerobaculia bacterium]|nr:hypothetical protein [Thermoanaerobaculia bacterium]
MSRRLSIVAAAAFAAAMVPSRAPAQPPPPWEDPVFASELRVHGFRFDNFFQAPESEPQEEVTLTRLEGRLSARPSEASAFELYTRGRFDSYSDDLEEAWALGVGLRWDRRPREADLYLEHEKDRPVFDVGDEFDRANVLRLAGEYGWRVTRVWQVTALAELARQEFDQTTGKDNDFLSAGGALRYRGWEYVFSPEIGAEWGERDAEDPNEDHDQRELWIKVRSLPVERLYLSLRYRQRTRDYSIGDPAASNFGREDDRQDWTLAADYRILDWLGASAYVSHEDADSTNPSRVYETTLAGLGLTFGW